MAIRIGTVTNVYPDTGKVTVLYDGKNASLPLPMVTMNGEYSMPAVGDRVLTLHMENGSSKGFVLGTYYGGGKQPMANSGYRKDFGGGVYAVGGDGIYMLVCEGGSLKLGPEMVLKAGNVTIEAENITLKCSYGTITAEQIMKRLERLEASV